MFGLTGVKSLFTGVDPEMAGSTVSNPSGPAQTSSAADRAAAEASQAQLWQQQQQAHEQGLHDQGQGYLGSMLAAGPNRFTMNMVNTGINHAPMPAAPPPQWHYQPGQGVVWQEPHRVINRAGTDPVSKNWAYSPADPGSIFTGNRI